MSENKKPLYQPWNEEEFQSDVFVRGMNCVQRWMYRSLLQASFFHSTRPYLPNDDRVLWVLAGCESRVQWEANKEVILERFTPVPDVEGMIENKRVTSDWRNLLAIREEMAEKGRARAANAQRGPGGTFSGKPVLFMPAKSSAQPADAGESSEITSGAPAREVKVSEDKISEEKESQGTNTTGGVVFDGEEGSQEKSSANLGGDWGELRSRHKGIFGKKPDKGFFFRKYLDACKLYSEDVVLTCFAEWAPTAAAWVKRDGVDHPLHAFLKKLPDMAAEEQESRVEQKQEQKTAAVQATEKKQLAATTEAMVQKQMHEHYEFMNYEAPKPNEGDPEEYFK